MKTTFFSFLTLATSITNVLSLPTSDTGLVKRASDPMDIVTSLYSTVQTHDAQINSTTAAYKSDTTPAEKNAAADSIHSNVKSMTAAVVASTAEVNALPNRSLDKRQAPASTTALAGILENILLDIGGALNGVIADLGLTTTLAFAGPLVTALGNLLVALDVVVDDLLAVVKQLVDGLLLGLGAALDGLVL
ncbi:hypothetical protein MMC12_002533 [Toensbergia leucococca]|nr:hypothetical protein [Toensbergia leucococca]